MIVACYCYNTKKNDDNVKYSRDADDNNKHNNNNEITTE